MKNKKAGTVGIANTDALRAALVHAAIGLGYDRTNPPHNANEADDRKAGQELADLARKLGATL
jgi:hypothetical protein